MRRTRQIWAQLIRQFEESGKTQEDFAKEREIPLTTFRSWIYRLRREHADPPPVLPVRVIASTAPMARDDGGAVVELELPDGVRLRFGREASSEIIVEVVNRLRRC